jgi:Bifunctional DNA primase/polymerase, N-terminal/Primase C terminal 1 (PriCT-1)
MTSARVSGSNESRRRVAMAYAVRLSWAVFPCIGKVPAIKGGRGCLDASTDPEIIASWWRDYPAANIGIAAGKASGFIVLDLDGDEGEDSLAALVDQYGEVPDTVEQMTGGGGRHLLFRHIGGIGNRTAIRPGIDVRGTGGYIVAAPSVHPETQRRYAWEVDHHPLDRDIAEAPPWLVTLMSKQHVAQIHRDLDRPEWMQHACVGVGEGARNDTTTRLAGHLLRRWVDAELAYELVTAWNATHCRPPLPKDEIGRTFSSVLERELNRRGA